MSRRDEPRRASLGPPPVLTVSEPQGSPSSANRVLTRGVLCYRCGAGLEVPARAQSASCPACHRQIHVADLQLRGPYWGAPVLTCGSVLVQKKARIVTSRVVSSIGVTVLGSLEAEVVTPGVLLIGAKGSLVGSVRAAALLIEPGGTLVGRSVAIARAARVDGINWTEAGVRMDAPPPRITVTAPQPARRGPSGPGRSSLRVG